MATDFITVKERSGYYWDVLAWRNSRRVKAMDPITRAIYREIMDEIWINGPIPNDIPQIATITGWPLDDVTRSWPVIHDCLTPIKRHPDLFTSARLEDERRRRNSIKQKRKEAAQNRWNANALACKSIAHAMQDSAITSTSNKKQVTSTSIKEEDTRLRLGEFGHVRLLPVDVEDLKARLNGSFDGLIAELDRYGETSPGKFAKYKSHKATLLSWFARRQKPNGQPSEIESRGQRLIRQQREESERLDTLLRGTAGDGIRPSDSSGTDRPVRKGLVGSDG